MAIAVISSVNKVADGTITVPTGCVYIIALVKGSIVAPRIDGVDMLTVAAIDATGVIPALSIHQYILPVITDLSFTFTGTYVHFIFCSGADSYRPGAIFGYASGGVYSAALVTDTTDLVVGILCGSIGPTTLKGDTVAFTYLVNTTVDKAGHITPGDTSLTSEAADTGVSAGYWIDNGFLHHDAVLITPAYHEYPATWHEGYNTIEWIYHPGYWQNIPGYWDYEVSPVVWHPAQSIWHGYYYTWVEVWHAGYYTYGDIFHEAVYDPAYDEELADTWVPAGTSQISACFCAIKTTPGGVFVSRPNVFG